MKWFKQGLKRYDDWCKEMGLTPDQKRSCVPYRKDPVHQGEEEDTVLLSSDTKNKSQDEAL